MNLTQWLQISEATYTDAMFTTEYLPRWVVDKILEIEKKAYPKKYQILNDEIKDGLINLDKITLHDLLEIMDCNGRPVFHIEDDWFIFCCDDGHELEIQDLASKKGLDFRAIVTLKNFFLRYKDRIFVADARESTSWKIIQGLIDKGVFEILQKDPWKWSGETFYDIKFRVKKKTPEILSKSIS